MSATRRVLVIGDIEIARLACTSLARHGNDVTHLLRPNEDDLRGALAGDVDAVAVLVRGDVVALRYALLAEHLRPGIRLVVMLFDRTVADQLLRAVPNCQVTSPADIAVPAIVGACLGPPVLAVDVRSSPATVFVETADGVASDVWRPDRLPRRIMRGFTRQLRPHDLTSRILLTGLAGLAVTLLLEWALAVLVLHQPAAAAFYTATRVVATVGSGEHPAPGWFLVLSGTGMLLTIGFSALFTAGIVNRFLSGRSVDIVGPRTLPTRDHVVVVGLGQVSLRLCMALRHLRIPVLAVERDPRAANLRLARAAGIPVLIAHAEDRDVLQRLSLHRARALAAMGADDLDNVEAAIAALALVPDLRVVLRAGDHAVINETRSLFPIGDVCDIPAMTAQAVTGGVNGASVHFVRPRDGESAGTGGDRVSRCACPVTASAGHGTGLRDPHEASTS
ncbi:NAD-binding protein [Actinomadura madurae]|nr:NAD-binding protein [Actinomadura madurae]MCP9968518.1 NAD-binding protein [Actinomadura madurae]MCQ0007512.1 NAD-binding protein [Actinomadura madurae]URM97204.1 NAD-binding protein [Actinomadura madurae]URN07971.1 NAD-binding protein [Actinomadura madurae]